jgi:hypothetical protein
LLIPIRAHPYIFRRSLFIQPRHFIFSRGSGWRSFGLYCEKRIEVRLLSFENGSDEKSQNGLSGRRSAGLDGT